MILTTDRLTLHAPQIADFPAYAEFLPTPRSQGVGGPLDTKAAWGSFTHDAALWHLFGHGARAGSIRVNAGPLFDEVEPGRMVYDGHTGQGLATGAAAVVRDGARGLPTLVCDVGVANAAPHGLAALQASPVAPARGHLPPSRRRSCHD